MATHPGLAKWHAYMASGGDLTLLSAMIADDAVFHSPVVHTPQAGKAKVMAYLGAAAQVLGGDRFVYVRELVDGNQVLLEFTDQLDGIHVTGFLLYNDRNFLQLIEGDADRIEQLMARIELDARHNGVVRLIDEDTEIRCAPDWAMRRIVMVPSPEGRLDGLLTVLPKLDPATATLVRNFVMLN